MAVYFLTRREATAGWRVPGFLELLLSANVYVYVCVFVCSPPRLLITSGVMWCDIDPKRLVKSVLWLLYGSCSRYR